MLGKGGDGAITVQGAFTGDVANILWNKVLRRVQTRKGQNNLVHTLS